MFIQFGIKEAPRRIGVIEDFCPICRSLRPAEVFDVKRITQVYFINVDTRSTGRFTTTCTTCHTGTVRKSNPFDELDPDMYQVDGGMPRARGALERARLEEMVDSGDVSPIVREALLREPFIALAPAWEHRLKNTVLNVRTLLVIIILFLVICGAMFTSIAYGMSIAPARVLPWTVGAFVVAVVLFPMIMIATTRFYVRRRLHPVLARSLQPLQPTLVELQAVVDELRAKKLMIGKAVQPEALCADIMTLDEMSLRR